MKVQRERERYKLSTQTLSSGFSAIPMMPINSAVKLISDSLSEKVKFLLFLNYLAEPVKSGCIIFVDN